MNKKSKLSLLFLLYQFLPFSYGCYGAQQNVNQLYIEPIACLQNDDNKPCNNNIYIQEQNKKAFIKFLFQMGISQEPKDCFKKLKFLSNFLLKHQYDLIVKMGQKKVDISREEISKMIDCIICHDSVNNKCLITSLKNKGLTAQKITALFLIFSHNDNKNIEKYIKNVKITRTQNTLEKSDPFLVELMVHEAKVTQLSKDIDTNNQKNLETYIKTLFKKESKIKYLQSLISQNGIDTGRIEKLLVQDTWSLQEKKDILFFLWWFGFTEFVVQRQIIIDQNVSIKEEIKNLRAEIKNAQNKDRLVNLNQQLKNKEKELKTIKEDVPLMDMPHFWHFLKYDILTINGSTIASQYSPEILLNRTPTEQEFCNMIYYLANKNTDVDFKIGESLTSKQFDQEIELYVNKENIEKNKQQIQERLRYFKDRNRPQKEYKSVESQLIVDLCKATIQEFPGGPIVVALTPLIVSLIKSGLDELTKESSKNQSFLQRLMSCLSVGPADKKNKKNTLSKKIDQVKEEDTDPNQKLPNKQLNDHNNQKIQTNGENVLGGSISINQDEKNAQQQLDEDENNAQQQLDAIKKNEDKNNKEENNKEENNTEENKEQQQLEEIKKNNEDKNNTEENEEKKTIDEIKKKPIN